MSGRAELIRLVKMCMAALTVTYSPPSREGMVDPYDHLSSPLGIFACNHSVHHSISPSSFFLNSSFTYSPPQLDTFTHIQWYLRILTTAFLYH